jgi:hypothetical protein
MHPIFNEIQNLPPQAQQQVVQLVATLLKENQRNSAHYLSQTWAGALCECRDTYTSLDLQQETVDEWANHVSD